MSHQRKDGGREGGRREGGREGGDTYLGTGKRLVMVIWASSWGESSRFLKLMCSSVFWYLTREGGSPMSSFFL